MPAVETSTSVASIPASRADASVCPTAATSGSVKMTRGASSPSPCRPRLLAEDVVGRRARLVLAHVGEERAAVDVADRVEPVVARRRACGRRPRAGRPGSIPTIRGRCPRRWSPADRDEQLHRLERLAAVELDVTALTMPAPDAHGLGPEADVDAVLAQRLGRPARRRTPPRAGSGARPPSTSVTCAARASGTPAPSRRRRPRRRARSGSPGRASPRSTSRLVQAPSLGEAVDRRHRRRSCPSAPPRRGARRARRPRR